MRMRRIIMLFSLLFSGHVLYAQNSFSKYLGGDVTDEGRAAVRDGDNYIIAVTTRSVGSPYMDIMLVRTDTTGNPQLTKYYKSQMGNAPGVAIAEVTDICKTSDGNYGLTGWSTYTITSPNGNSSYTSLFYIKVDQSFNILLSKFYTTGPDEGSRIANRIKSDGQGNIYITGVGGPVSNNSSSFNITKINEQTGMLVWSKNFVNITLVGAENGTGYDIEFLNDTNGNLVAAGTSNDNVHLFKLDPSGQVIWGRQITTPALYEGIQSIAIDGNGNIVCAGAIAPGINSNIASTMLMSVAPNGDLQWIKSFMGDSISDYLLAKGLNILPDGIYAVGNLARWSTPSTWAPNQVHYFKTDLNGNLAWSYMFGDTADKNDEVFRSFVTANNDWGFVGTSDGYRPPTLDTYKGVIFVKPGSDGELCNYSYSLPHQLNDLTAALSPYYMQATVQSYTEPFNEENANFTEHSMQLYSQDICPDPSAIEEEADNEFILSPNPAHDVLYIKGMKDKQLIMRMYSVDGQLVMARQVTSAIDISSLPAGLFILQLLTEDGNIYYNKLIKE